MLRPTPLRPPRAIQSIASCRQTVSARFRALIEENEPGVHQLEPIRFIAKDGAPLADRWFWQVCNRIDSVHRERTNWVLDRSV
jgi:hypothetical protein